LKNGQLNQRCCISAVFAKNNDSYYMTFSNKRGKDREKKEEITEWQRKAE